MTPEQHDMKMQLIGAYQALDLIMRSPRMNKPQREVIEEVAADFREQLEALDVSFRDRTPEERLA